MTHTPGPWRVDHRHIHAERDSDEMSGLGWELTGPRKPMRGDFARAADAHLAAAAPDLLEALEGALTPLAGAAAYLETIGTDEALLHVGMARAKIENSLAAVKKARGES